MQALDAPHVHGADAQDSTAGTGGCDVLGHALRLFGVAAYDAGVGAQVNEGAHLAGADASIAAGAEDDFACEEVVFPDVGEVFVLWDRHFDDERRSVTGIRYWRVDRRKGLVETTSE